MFSLLCRVSLHRSDAEDSEFLRDLQMTDYSLFLVPYTLTSNASCFSMISQRDLGLRLSSLS